MGIKSKYEEAWKAIIKPPKFKFEKSHLGPENQTIDNVQVKHTTFRIYNKDNKLIEGSFYHPID